MQLGAFDDEDDATTLRQIDINVIGVMYGLKELALPKHEGARAAATS